MITFETSDTLKENVDYELIPSDGENWNVRFLSGEFTETVIQYKAIHVSEDEEYMKFNFDIVSSPDINLSDEEYALQKRVGAVLYSILENAAETVIADTANKESNDKR